MGQLRIICIAMQTTSSSSKYKSILNMSIQSVVSIFPERFHPFFKTTGSTRSFGPSALGLDLLGFMSPSQEYVVFLNPFFRFLDSKSQPTAVPLPSATSRCEEMLSPRTSAASREAAKLLRAWHQNRHREPLQATQGSCNQESHQ